MTTPPPPPPHTPPGPVRPLSRRRRRQRRNQRLRIAIELVIGAAAIWFVAHPRTLPTLPPDLAPADTGLTDSVGRSAPAEAAPGGTGVPPADSASGPLIILPSAPLPKALVPAGRLFRSIEERARAGERIAVSMTAYCLQGRTRRGNLVRDGIVAVDRKLFPLGREVDLFFGRKKYGRFLADDTGGAIKGGRIDVWMADCAAARRFGRRRGYAQLVPRDE